MSWKTFRAAGFLFPPHVPHKIRFSRQLRAAALAAAALLLTLCLMAEPPEPQPASAKAAGCTLTVVVEGVRNSTGTIGYLLFNSATGWPDELKSAYRGGTVKAVAGRTIFRLENLPPGEYGVLVIHDENGNRKLDKDWKGMPIEQWGMSNNPRVFLSTPPFRHASFRLAGDREIHIALK
jgi:uncharacterized protein (DUF2141 family)